MRKTHLVKWKGWKRGRLYSWCGRGVSSPIPTHIPLTGSPSKATCKMCHMAWKNNKKAKKA